MNTAYPVFLGICLTGMAVRTIYELLKISGRVNQNNKAAIAIVFLAMCMMLSSWCFMCPLDPWRIGLPFIVKLSGLGMLITGLGIALGGLIQLRGVENIDHLVTGGIFSRIRHPMYTGFILWILGWVIYYGAIVSLIVALVCIGNILYLRRIEEENLLSAYGEAYLTYRAKTWF
jgi:protein-S-isoprenylcysteine O-methyltransferase Ste14